MIPVAVLKRLRATYWFGLRRLWRGRRAWLLVRLRVTAILRHGAVEVDVAPDVLLGRRVRVEIDPGTANRLVLRPGCRIQDGVVIWLRGGTVDIGSRTGIRHGARLNSSGRLIIGDEVIVSYGAVLHCAQELTVAEMTIIGEYSTLTDSTHRRTRDEPILHHVRTAPTTIGRNVWVGASAVVAAGVEIGDRAVVASHSVVTSDVAPQWLVAGAPARGIRELEIDEEVEGT